MYNTCCKDEVVIKMVGKLTLAFPTINQLTVRDLVEEVLYKYNVAPTETGLVTSDMEDKLQMYLAVKKLEGLSARTLKNYNYNLVILSDHLRKPLATVTSTDMRMYLAVRCKSLKASSVNGQITILKSFFSWLHSEEYIPKNPMLKVKQTKEPRSLRHPMNDEEIELLRQACKTDREKSIIEFLVTTGCRLSEAVDVNKSDVCWSDMSLYVVGKGSKERKVYFNAKAKILLNKYLATRNDDSPALFVSVRKPHNRLGCRAIQKEIKNVAKRAGLDKSVYPHLLRHTFATRSINAGMPLPVLQKIMGHEDPGVTQIYAKISEENIKHEYKRIS